MTLHKGINFAIVLFLVSCTSNAAAPTQDDLCKVLPQKIVAAEMQNCSQRNGTTNAKYSKGKVNSPYATDLDELNISVTISKNKMEIFEIYGLFFTEKSKELKLKETKRDLIPLPEGIYSRNILQPTNKYGWNIYEENIEYFNPKGAGYSIKCATAIKRQKSEFIAVAGCLPYEQVDEFSESLKFIEIN